ncbi:baseplate J/gp47 family protein, partial [Pseudarthrobacter equi]
GELYVLTPTPKPVNYQIRLTPDTGPVRAAVTAALQALILAEASLGVTLPRSHQDEAISGAVGEEDHEMVVPAESVTVLRNEIATFGGIAWL